MSQLFACKGRERVLHSLVIRVTNMLQSASRIRHPVPSSPPPTCLPLPGSLYLPPYAAGRVCKRNEIMLIFAATKRMTL